MVVLLFKVMGCKGGRDASAAELGESTGSETTAGGLETAGGPL
jgi:hypothetical protein